MNIVEIYAFMESILSYDYLYLQCKYPIVSTKLMQKIMLLALGFIFNRYYIIWCFMKYSDVINC